MLLLLGLLITFVLLSVSVMLHEFGHMMVMLRNGVKVLEYSFGFGKVLWQRTAKSGITYSFRAIPLGGFVKPVQDGPESVQAKRPWVQFKIFVAGMLMNALISFVVLLVVFLITRRVPVIVLDYTKSIPLPGTAILVLLALVGSFGIWLATPPLVVVMLVKMGLGFFKQSAGPIGIMMMGSQIVTQSPSALDAVFGLAFFFALINSSVAGFNLIPLAGLDGGWIFELLIKKLFGRWSVKVISGWRSVTTILLIILFVGVILRDFLRLLPASLGGG